MSTRVTLPSDTEVETIRAFRAPRALVWRTFTEPQFVSRWSLGPPGWTMPVCEMDVRVGGKFRWRWRSDDGSQEFGFYGEYRVVEAPERCVHTETYDPGTVGGTMAGEALITLTLTESGGVTTVTTRMDFGSKEARDGAVASGMTDGMEMGYQRLDAILAAQAA